MRKSTKRSEKRPHEGAPRARVRPEERETPAVDELDEGVDPDAGALVDQGDGVRVARGRRRTADEEKSFELPDEPPRGYFGGDE